MEFNKAYNREDFLSFLKVHFLPEDFTQENTNVVLRAQTKYTRSAVKLGVCKSLDLVVYEIKHTSVNDARVGLSKEAFRMLADEWESRALVLFVPVNSNANYRFSLINIDLSSAENGKIEREYSNPRRYSYYLGEEISGERTPELYLEKKGRVKDNKDLQERFSVDVLTKAFYQEISDWYAWAIEKVEFPGEKTIVTDEKRIEHRSKNVIRLLTRLLFVWFLKQKNLIPWQLFDEEYLKVNLLKDFDPNLQIGLWGNKSLESKYYKAILQNLFFATLNCPIIPQSKEDTRERGFRKKDWYGQGFGHDYQMRYEDFFINASHFLEIVNNQVPFLNGGLFDCLDDKEHSIYIDGFSDNLPKSNLLKVPDFLFFGEKQGKGQDLSGFYGDKKKKCSDVIGLLDILKRYNFTIEENTPFDQEVSLDPELLGKVFENLLASYNPETKTTARKQTGSFYTPREIVQYMVDESLVAHLKRTVGDEYENDYRKLMRYNDEMISGSVSKIKIIKSLLECKVLDPACGSGAFPVGVLQQMVHILSQLDPNNEMWKDIILEESMKELSSTLRDCTQEERDEIQEDINRNFDDSINRPDYARKLYLIEKCIYGVDIQSIAVQISKLRFFISLVVDQKSTIIKDENFGIRPLPNLEAKFVAANSLIGLRKRDPELFDDKEIEKLQGKMVQACHRIFGAKSNKTKNKYRARVEELQSQISDKLETLGAVGNDDARLMKQWKMFDQNASSPFFDQWWMFGVEDGFDIIIGNPPYVQLQDNNGALAEQLKNCSYETFTRTGDLYCIFYERGFQLLKDKGHLCFITSNKWMRAGYGEITRSFFVNKTNPKLLIDFSGVKIFESATVDTNILLFAKEKNTGKTLCAVTKKEDKDRIKDLSVFVQQSGTINSFRNSDSWVILSPIEQCIKQKIEAIGTPLKEWDIKINYGIKTGFNDAFIIATEKRNEILSTCQNDDEQKRTAELIRPILRGRDIKRYGYDWADLWLINVHNGIKGKLPIIDIYEYPAIKAYLDQYWDKIKDRADQGDTPYNLRNCAYMEDFFKPKIIYPNMTKYLPFVWDNSQYLTNQKCFIITGESTSFLTAFLNSSLFKFCFRDSFPELQGGTRELSKIFFDKISVLKVKSETEQLFTNAVLDIQAEYTKLKAIAIDAMIFDLYGLTQKEKETIGFIDIK